MISKKLEELDSEFERLEVKFDELLRRIKRIEERLDALHHPPQPVPSPFPFTPFTPPTTPWDTKTCPKCGLELKGVMGYACPQPGCPTGLGGPSCKWNVD